MSDSLGIGPAAYTEGSMKPTLLIVDDVQSVRDKLRQILENEFEVVGVAGNAVEAIRFVEKSSPQLILMDLVMPQMSGIDATKAIMALPQCTSRVVILSALTDENIVLRALEAGASEYLVKPISESKIRAVLHSLVQPLKSTGT